MIHKYVQFDLRRISLDKVDTKRALLTTGADVTFVGFNHNQRLVTNKTSVVDVTDITVFHP